MREEMKMIAMKIQKITFNKDGYIVTVQNKEGLLNIFFEPQDIKLSTSNYIILENEYAKYLYDTEYLTFPDNITEQDIIYVLEKVYEVR